VIAFFYSEFFPSHAGSGNIKLVLDLSGGLYMKDFYEKKENEI